MNVSLTPELESLVQEKGANGMYHSASEVIREGLRLIKERDAFVANNGHSGTLSLPPPIETQTQIANRLFRERVAKIADAQVTIREGSTEWEPIFYVEVPEIRSKAFDKVVKLRGDLYRKYPKAAINVEFRPRRELEEARNHPRFADV